MTTHPTPSYDDWLNQCTLFIRTVKDAFIKRAGGAKPVPASTVQLAEKLEAVVAPMVDERIEEQEHDRHAPTSHTAQEVECDIGFIKEQLEKNRPELELIATEDGAYADVAMHLIGYIDRENHNYSAPRMTNVVSFKDTQKHLNELLVRQAIQPQGGRVFN